MQGAFLWLLIALVLENGWDVPAHGAHRAAHFLAASPVAAVGAGRRAAPHSRGVITHVSRLKLHHHNVNQRSCV